MRSDQKSVALLADKIKNYISQLAIRVSRGNYFDGIPTSKVSMLGRRKFYWDMLTVGMKQTYLRMMAFIVKDKHEDFHLGDANFQNTIIGGRIPFINAISRMFSEFYTLDPFFEWPQKLHERIEVSKSDFKYGKLMQVAATYMNIQSNPDSRARRYSYNCLKCKIPYTQGSIRCQNGHIVEPEGYPKVLPDNKDAQYASFKQYDQIASGIEEAMLLTPKEQEDLIIENVIGNTNSGYPFFEKQQKDKITKMFFRFCKFCHYKWRKTDVLTIQAVFDLVKWLHKKEWHFPYVLFARTQGGKDGTKHRCVFGAPFIQKLIAAVIGIGKHIGYYRSTNDFVDDEVFTKHIYAVGKLPIVAQANWDEMFSAILRRIPDVIDDSIAPFSAAKIKELFGYNFAPGDYAVNVIGDDFPGFDTGQITEDFEGLRKHKKLGWLFGYMLDDMKFSEVWTANKILKDIQYKSGFPMTSEFGSYLHRKANYNAAAETNTSILANINLSDDDIIFTIGLTPELIDTYLRKFGLKIKVDESFNYFERPIVGFLKVLVGYSSVDGAKIVIGDPVSRYYGLAHSEREIEQEVGSMDFKADVRGIYQITGVVEVDAFLSKLASWGSEGKAVVRTICEIVKNTDLGQKAILAISRLKVDGDYKPYRDDLDISFPPNWLAGVDVADLIVDFHRLQ